MSRYTPEPFKPDGGFSVAGLPIMLLLLAAAGAAVGWLASFVGQWFYLIVIFPAAMGFALFFAAILGAKVAKLRSWPIATLSALFGAAVAVGTLHYFNYLRAVQELAGVIPADKQLTFLDFLQLEATIGITIGKRGGGLNIGYWGTWIYWTLEYLAVAAIAVMGFGVQVTEPFCKACERWKDEKQLGTLNRKGVNVASFVESGEIERLKEHDPAPAGNDMVLTVYSCPNCKEEGTIVVKLDQVKKNDKGEESRDMVANFVYPGEALAELEEMFAFGAPTPRRGKDRDRGDDY